MQHGKALYTAGRFIEAAEILQQAAQDYQQQGDALRQAIALSNLALAYQKSGLLLEATQAISTSLNLLGLNLLGLNLLESSSPLLDQERDDRSQILAQTVEIQGSLQFAHERHRAAGAF